MLYWIFQVTLFSIIFILLVHHIIHFLKSTLTVPKVKDLVNTRNQKYENMYNIITNSNQKQPKTQQEHNYSIEDLLPMNKSEDICSSSMKNELKHFLKTQLTNVTNDTNNTADTTDISTLDRMNIYSNI
jgi:hypothetical protein